MKMMSLNHIRRMSTLSSRALVGLETRWVKLPECEQGAIADTLAVAQKGDWKKMTLEQKRAAYFVAYGPYGARSPLDPLFNWKVMGWTGSLFGLCGVIYWAWYKFYVKPLPVLGPEFEAAQKQSGIENKANPFTGAYAEHLEKTQKSV